MLNILRSKLLHGILKIIILLLQNESLKGQLILSGIDICMHHQALCRRGNLDIHSLYILGSTEIQHCVMANTGPMSLQLFKRGSRSSPCDHESSLSHDLVVRSLPDFS